MNHTGDPYRPYSAIYDHLRKGLTAVDLAFYLDLARHAGGPVLELACGTGRVLLPCAEITGRAVGVDNSPSMLDECRRIRSERGLDSAVTLHLADMCSVRLGERFPLVIMGGQPLAFLPSDDQLLEALATVREHLTPEGRFVAAMPVPQLDDLARGQHETRLADDFVDAQGRRTVVWNYTVADALEQRVTLRRIIETLDEEGVVVQRRHAVHELTFRHPRELRRLLADAGLKIVEEYGGYGGQPLTSGASTFVWLATVS